MKEVGLPYPIDGGINHMTCFAQPKVSRRARCHFQEGFLRVCAWISTISYPPATPNSHSLPHALQQKWPASAPRGMRGLTMASAVSQASLARRRYRMGNGRTTELGEECSEFGSMDAEFEVRAGYPRGKDCGWDTQTWQILRHGDDAITGVGEKGWAAPQRKKSQQTCCIRISWSKKWPQKLRSLEHIWFSSHSHMLIAGHLWLPTMFCNQNPCRWRSMASGGCRGIRDQGNSCTGS